MREVIAERRNLFTTNFIPVELHALPLARMNREIAVRVLTEVENNRLTTVVRVSARDERRARAIILQYDNKDFSLTDATSFAVMERLVISQALTLDQDFVQFGWMTLGPVRT